jgi:hypothetical protein
MSIGPVSCRARSSRKNKEKFAFIAFAGRFVPGKDAQEGR